MLASGLSTDLGVGLSWGGGGRGKGKGEESDAFTFRGGWVVIGRIGVHLTMAVRAPAKEQPRDPIPVNLHADLNFGWTPCKRKPHPSHKPSESGVAVVSATLVQLVNTVLSDVLLSVNLASGPVLVRVRSISYQVIYKANSIVFKLRAPQVTAMPEASHVRHFTAVI